MKSNHIRWGIIGTGFIAHQFANALQSIQTAEIIAVLSRTQKAADTFGDTFDIPHRHTDIQALVDHPEIDIIYVATPHTRHYSDTITCLRGKKHVLCEKPLGIHTDQVEHMIACAKENNRFLMEGMWTRFFPAMKKVRTLLNQNAIGEIRQLQASFCFRAESYPKGRLFDPELAGGALLDVGIYTLALSEMVFQSAPVEVISTAHIGCTGVDEQTAIILRYKNGAIATLNCAVHTETPHEATIFGTKGSIHIPHQFWKPDRIIITKDGQSETESFPTAGIGYHYEAEAVMDCLRNNQSESPIYPLSTSLGLMKLMDTIRKQIGLQYPGE